VLDPNNSSDPQTTDLFNTSYEYDYPEGLNLKPGSKTHIKIKREILSRARDSRNVLETRFDSWNNIDRTLTVYVKPEEGEDKEHDPSRVIVPVSYATLETLLTYLSAAFIQDPIFKYVGVGPEDTLGAIMLEKVIQHHCKRSKVGLSLHTQFRDALCYGFGVSAPTWSVIKGKQIRRKETGFLSSLTGLFNSTGYEKVEVDTTLFEGNKLENIDPYMYLPDPNVPVHDVQKGEYVGWLDRDNVMSLLERERDDEDIFNVKYLNHLIDGKSTFSRTEMSSRKNDRLETGNLNADNTNAMDIISMYITIVPKDWELGSSEYPEKWFFALAGDEVVITAKPLGLSHNMFPVAVCSPDFDGYSVTPTSRLEVVYGLQEIMDWLFSSHIANVRKSINDMLIVDPSLVNIKDLQDPEPGKLIRLRRSAWGRGVGDAVKQLGVTDITRGNIADSQYISDMIQRVSAATDTLQGIMRTSGERRSATEAQSSRSGALSRLEKTAKLIGSQAMQDIGYMFASHTQQLMSEDVYVKTSGAWEEVLKKEYGIDNDSVSVNPTDLVIDYDVASHDGSMPGGEPSDLWVQLFQVISSQPEVAQQFDLFRIVKHIARQMGAKNVDDFIKKGTGPPPQVMPDEQVQKEAEKGNLVPMNGAQGGV